MSNHIQFVYLYVITYPRPDIDLISISKNEGLETEIICRWNVEYMKIHNVRQSVIMIHIDVGCW